MFFWCDAISNGSLCLRLLTGHQEMVSQTSAGGGMWTKCCISQQKPVGFDKWHTLD